MGYVISALWHGLVAGAVAKPGTTAAKPTFDGSSASVAETLYALGYAVAEIVVHGRSRA